MYRVSEKRLLRSLKIRSASDIPGVSKRPAFFLCMTFLVGLLSAMWQGGVLWFPLVLCLCGGFLCIFGVKERAARILLFLMICSLCLGGIRGRQAFRPFRVICDERTSVEGTVLQVQPGEDRVSFIFRTQQGVRIRAASTEAVVQEGDRVRLTGRLQGLAPPENPGGFNLLVYDGARGIRQEMQVDTCTVLSEGHFPYYLRCLFLSRVRTTLARLLPQEQAGAILAILTGDRSSMDKDMTSVFQDCGIAHIIAVSGLHIQVLCDFLEKILQRFCARRKALFLTACIVWFYCFLTGGQVSTWRAALMLTIRIGAVFAGRKEDALNSLGFSALVILVVRPLYIFDAAFQLSYMASLALIIAQRPWLRCYRIPKGIRRRCAASLAVVTWCAPVTLQHFHQVSLHAVLLNLVVVPLMSVVITASLLSVLLSVVSAGAARFLMGCVYYVLVFYRESCILLLKLPGGILKTGALPWPAVICFYAGYGIWIGMHGVSSQAQKRKKRWATACMFILCLSILQYRMQTQVLFLSVGQGDCALIKARGRAYLVDAGPGYDRVLKPCLTYYGIQRISGIFLTHKDQDHSEGVQRLLTDPDFTVQELYLPEHPVHDFHEITMENAEHMQNLTAGDHLEMAGLKIRVLSPDPQAEYADQNSASLCLQVGTKHGTICFMGDADQAAEEMILASGRNVQCDVLKVGHHGSRTSSSEAFLMAAEPGAAWISCKKDNSYGHPHPEVLARLSACGVRPVISYESGCLVMDRALYTYQEAYRKRWMQ